MNILSIGVRKREKVGRGNCRRLRRSGRIPIVFYGKSFSVTYSLAETDFRAMDKYLGATLVELEPDEGESSLALIKEVQRDPCTDEVLHVDFVEVTRGQELQTKVPLVIVGEAIGVKLEGGILDVMAREIELRCRPSLLPNAIEIDVSDLNLGDSFHISDLPEIEDVTYLADTNLTLVSCVGTASGRADADELVDGATEGGDEETEDDESEGEASGDESSENAPGDSGESK
ncbi:MAG: 50S ribosomal protein L25 [Opitutales bacterium]